MDDKLERYLSEKEMFCLSKHIQELKEIVYNSCSTCKHQVECSKSNFEFEKDALLHLEKITNNVCRKPLLQCKKTLNISVSLGQPDIDVIAKELCKRLEKAGESLD